MGMPLWTAGRAGPGQRGREGRAGFSGGCNTCKVRPGPRGEGTVWARGTQICGKTGTAQGTKWADEGYKAWPGALSGALPPVWLSATWMNLAVLGPALDLSCCFQPIHTCQETRHSRGLASQSRVHRSPPEPGVGTAHLQRQRAPGQAESAL